MADLELTTDATVLSTRLETGVDSSDFVDGFEDGDVSEWTVNDLSAVQDRAFNGSYAGFCDTAQSGTYQARRVPSSLSGGAQIERFEFYWQETSNSKGGGIRLLNSNENVEIGVATDNPGWYIDDANGQAGVKNAGDYNDWTRFTVDFDWAAGTFSVNFEDTADGTRFIDSGRPLKAGQDIETIQIDNFHTGGSGWQDGSSIEMWFDDIAAGQKESVSAADLSVLVEEDTDGDGVFENSATASISDGTTTQTLSGFDVSAGNDVRIIPQFSVPNTTASAAELDSATVSPSQPPSGTAVSLPANTITAKEPGLILAPGAIMASLPVGTISAQEPRLDIAFDQFPALPPTTLTAQELGVTTTPVVGLPVESLTAEAPALAVTTPEPQTLSLPVQTITAQEPGFATVTGAFLTNGQRVSDDAALGVTDLQSTHKELTISWRADVDNLDALRDLQPGAGDLRVIDDANGEWETVADSGGTAVDVALAPPDRLRPPLEPGTFYVRSYRESPGRAGQTNRVTARFVRETPRETPADPASQTAGSDEWAFDFETGTIATEYVRRAAQAGQDRASLELALTAEQAEVILTVPNQVDAVSEEQVPDGDDFVRDNTENSVQTVTINRPSNLDPKWWPDDGDYVVTGWRITDFGPPRVLVELDVRLASGSLS